MKAGVESRPRVLIQGAGIAGLTLAGRLERRGVEYRVVEQARILEPVGAGLVIQPNARAILEALGLGEALAQAGCGLKTLSVGPAGHARSLTFPNRQFAIGLHRADLHRMLLSIVPEERLRLGCSLSGWQAREKSIEARLNTGDAWTATHLIGADGLHSAVRHRLKPLDTLRDSGQWCWRTVLPAQPLGPHGLEWVRGTTRLGAIPIGGHRTYLYWVETDADAGSAPTVHDLNAWGPEGRALGDALPTDPHWLSHPLSDRPVRWGTGNRLLIGDAAHPVTPNLGQGAALGMEDAWVLAGLLMQGQGSAEALKRQRHRRVDNVRRLSWWAGRFAHGQGFPGTGLRDRLYRLMPPQWILRSQQSFVAGFFP